jgi:hypothetical protein
MRVRTAAGPLECLAGQLIGQGEEKGFANGDYHVRSIRKKNDRKAEIGQAAYEIPRKGQRYRSPLHHYTTVWSFSRTPQ